MMSSALPARPPSGTLGLPRGSTLAGYMTSPFYPTGKENGSTDAGMYSLTVSTERMSPSPGSSLGQGYNDDRSSPGGGHDVMMETNHKRLGRLPITGHYTAGEGGSNQNVGAPSMYARVTSPIGYPNTPALNIETVDSVRVAAAGSSDMCFTWADSKQVSENGKKEHQGQQSCMTTGIGHHSCKYLLP